MGAVTTDIQGGIALVKLDRGGKANALSFEIMDELAQTALELADDVSLRAVVLTGTDRVFSAGMDLSDPFFDSLPDASLDDMRHYAERGPRMVRAWHQMEAPVVCAVEGAAMGGGLVLAAAGDFRVCAANARFSAPEVQVAHNMGWHSVPRLIAMVGAPATRRLLMAGEEWSGEYAHRLGFADYVCEQGDALVTAMQLAQKLADYPSVAMRMIKRQVDAAAHGNDFAVSAFDKDQQLAVWMSDDFAEARKRFAR